MFVWRCKAASFGAIILSVMFVVGDRLTFLVLGKSTVESCVSPVLDVCRHKICQHLNSQNLGW